MRTGYRGLTLERDLQATIIEAAQRLGYRVYWTHRSDRSPAGFPDLCMVRPTDGRLIFAELKNERNKLTDHQVDWIRALESVEGIEVYIWRPDDLSDALEVLAA